MRVGVSLFFQNYEDYDRHSSGSFDTPPVVPDHVVFEDELRLADLAESLGFDSLWTVEHHFSPYAMTANPLLLLAHLAARTTRVDLGTMVVVAPWHDPVRVAEEMSLVDNLLGGRRLMIGLGRGAAAPEFEGLRVPIDESRTRLAETVEIIRRALTSQRFSFDGDHFRVRDVGIRPRPRSEDLTTGMFCAWSSEESMQFAAEEGLGQMFISLQSWDHAAASSAAFNEIRARRGWEPVAPISVVFVYCAETPSEAAEGATVFLPNMMDASIRHYDLLTALGGGDADLAEIGKTLTDTFVGLNVCGTPAECVAKIAEIQATVRNAETICVFKYGAMPVEKAEASMRLFAREVLPAVRELPADRALSTPYESVQAVRSDAREHAAIGDR